MKEVKDLVVETCTNVITKLAEDQQTEKENLLIRIDMETIKSKPVFGLFNGSSCIGKLSMKEIIKAGGGQGLSMVLGTYIKKIFSDIFRQSMTQLNIEYSRNMFVLLYLKGDNGEFNPMLSIYHNKEFMSSMRISEALETTPKI